MEKLEKIFNSKKGIIFFYIIVALLAYLITRKIEIVNSQAEHVKEVEKTCYA